jgi:6-phosphogluconolactonase
MVSVVSPDVRIFPDLDALSRAAALGFHEFIIQAARPNKQIFIALTGGNTPRSFYQQVGEQFKESLPWKQMVLFWGDERWVPSDHPQSNYHMAKETLLDFVPIPATNVHPIPTALRSPKDAVVSYQTLLKSFFASSWPTFDLVLLGMGADGHIASLFPNSSELEESERWVVASRAPVEPHDRITLTLPVLNHAAQIYFLVSGAEKAHAFARALSTPESRDLPASRVRQSHGNITWWVDEAAAALIDSRSTALS